MTPSESTRNTEWDQLSARHLKAPAERPASTARGIHHAALISTDVEATIDFYQGLLGFPLTELFENRDYTDSTHFFFDVGNGNYLAFFDFPGLDLAPFAEVVGGLHHIAISIDRPHWETARERLIAAGKTVDVISHSSMYFSGPDNEHIELISDPLGELYGIQL